MKLKRLGALVLALVALVSVPASQAVTQQEAMLNDLQTIQRHFELYYAPFEWKKKYANWDLATAVKDAEAKIQADASLSVSAYHRILKDFTTTTKDYHVGISFQNTERASLPFTVKVVAGKAIVVYVDRSKAPEDAFPFHNGDELVSVDGKLAADLAVELGKLSEGETVPGTDLALGSLFVTRRSAASGFAVPKGQVNLVFLRQGEAEAVTHQMTWDYTPESLTLDIPSLHTLTKSAPKTAAERANAISNKLMTFARGDLLNTDLAANPYGLGTRVGYLPDLGTKIWESAADSKFYAYIYKNAKGKMIGVVRLPTYSPEGEADKYDVHARDFEAVVAKFESLTDMMVIDQLNNPGGSVYYLYRLASMLSSTALTTPKHKRMLTSKDVLDSLTLLKELAPISDDLTAKLVLGATLGAYPVTYQLVLSLRDEANFIVSEWNAGRRFANPYHLGVDMINPGPVHYTKPILLLTNELDFSGGDFFPTIMQDNKRVTVMGARTAGAGGYVLDFSFPNTFGIDGIRVTGSIAQRVTGNPIENLGVTPDVPYTVTEKDVRGGYADYAAAINAQVEKMTP